jgi:hypothetical protein
MADVTVTLAGTPAANGPYTLVRAIIYLADHASIFGLFMPFSMVRCGEGHK